MATERTCAVTTEPLENAVLVEDMGARHGPERRHDRLCASCVVLLISVSQRLEADSTVIIIGEDHLFETINGLAGGGDVSRIG